MRRYRKKPLLVMLHIQHVIGMFAAVDTESGLQAATSLQDNSNEEVQEAALYLSWYLSKFHARQAC